MLVHRIMLV